MEVPDRVQRRWGLVLEVERDFGGIDEEILKEKTTRMG